MGVRWRAALGLAWLVALATVLGIAAQRRVGDEGNHDIVIRHGPGIAGAITMVVFTVPAIMIAVWSIRHRFLAIVVNLLGALVTCFGGWSVMHDTHSTVGIGIFGIPFYAYLLVALGVGFDRALVDSD